MSDEKLFQDSVRMQKITPYSKLRRLRGLSQGEVADRLQISKRSLIDIERGARDAPKRVALNMDELYGCKGKLVEYWLNVKFSMSQAATVTRAIKKLRTRCEQVWSRVNHSTTL